MACYGLFCLVLVDGDLRVCEYFTDKISVSFSVCLSHCLFLSLSLSLSLLFSWYLPHFFSVCLLPVCLILSVHMSVCLLSFFLSACLVLLFVLRYIQTNRCLCIYAYLCGRGWGWGGGGLRMHACVYAYIYRCMYDLVMGCLKRCAKTIHIFM